MSTTTRIHFSIWGTGSEHVSDGYAVQQDGESRAEAVARSISRRLGRAGLLLGSLCGQGTAISNVGPDEHHYSAAIGRRNGGGGMSGMGEIWISIPADETSTTGERQ